MKNDHGLTQDKKSVNYSYDHILDDISRKLHDRRGSKAAVMVGSGFSLNAIPRRGVTSRFPLWSDLTGHLVKSLYPNPDEARKVISESGAVSAAMRLAQEFEAAFGRHALVEAVREAIPDEQYTPSPIHENLVDLPWADVYTTNYDRLLEVATRSRPGNPLRRQSYDVVTRASDLPLARRPRIVKLHGSLPDLDDLILTEEDFRTYEKKYAPLVNTVRASLSENTFCLFGFSGDDPNFLAWTGWIRDTLRHATPKIYMFCRELPTSFKCQLMEERNVTPVPIGFLSGKESFFDAYQWLLNRLCEGHFVANASIVPRDISSTSSSIFKAAIEWRKTRLESASRWRLRNPDEMTWFWHLTKEWILELSKESFATLPSWKKIFVLREIYWRVSHCLMPMFDDDVIKVVEPALAAYEAEKNNYKLEFDDDLPVSAEELEECVAFLRLELLRHAREIGDAERFEEISELINDSSPDEEGVCFGTYQRCLFHQGRFEQSRTLEALQNWRTESAAPIWTIRKAGLLLELGELDHATEILIELSNELSTDYRTPNIDFTARSTEGLALYLLYCCKQAISFLRTEPENENELDLKDKDIGQFDDMEIGRRLDELNNLDCDPRRLLEQFEFTIAKNESLESASQKSDAFDLGATSFNNKSLPDISQAYQAMRFIDDAGLPIAVRASIGVSVAKKLFHDAALRIASANAREGVGLVLRALDRKLASRFLTRETLRKLDEATVDFLCSTSIRFIKACNEGRFDNLNLGILRSRLACALIVLNRGITRLSDRRLQNESVELLRMSAHKTTTSLNLEECASLTRRIVECTPNSTLKLHLREFAEFPIQDNERAIFHSVDPVSYFQEEVVQKSKRPTDFNSEFIATLISRVGEEKEAVRRNAISRLESLRFVYHLSKNELRSYRDALFAQADEFGLPGNTGHLDFLVLTLPKGNTKNESRLLVDKYLNDEVPVKAVFWFNVRRSSVAEHRGRWKERRVVKWNLSDLHQLLEKALRWIRQLRSTRKIASETSNTSAFLTAMRGDEVALNQEALEHLVRFLGAVVVPMRQRSDNIVKVISECVETIESKGYSISSLYPSLACFGIVSSQIAKTRVEKDCMSSVRFRWEQGFLGIVKWAQLSDENHFSLPKVLIDLLLSSLAIGDDKKFPSLLFFAEKVLDLNCAISQKVGNAIARIVSSRVEESLSDTLDSLRDTSLERQLHIRMRCYQASEKLLKLGIETGRIQQVIANRSKELFADMRNS